MNLKHALLLLSINILVNCDNFPIGGIFDDNTEAEDVFNFVVESLNSAAQIFTPVTAKVENGNGFKALNAACAALDSKVIAIFGPGRAENIYPVQSLCDDKDIPHLITSWVYKPSLNQNSINFHPNPKILTQAYVDIVLAFEWKSFALVYEDNESLLKTFDLVRVAKEKGVVVTLCKLEGVYRSTFKSLRDSGEVNFVIDCKTEVLGEVLLQIQQVGLLYPSFNFIFTNLDLHTLDLLQFQYSEANITGLQLVDPQNELKYKLPKLEKTSTDSALLIDSVVMFAEAFNKIEISNFDDIGCKTSNRFPYGTTLINFLKGSEHLGLTGLIKFDHQGLRSVFNLDVLELTSEGISKFGTWNITKGLSIQRPGLEEPDEDPNSLRNRTFVVITCLTDPYGMLKESPKPLFGNDRYEGFGIDLIHELAQMEGFNYTFVIREDKKNGVKDPKTGKWSGMIGDLIEYRADLAITDLTITAERVSAVDFTTPFMNLGISILAKKPGKAPPSFFSFADPFAIDTWVMLVLAYVVVSLSLFIIGRLCPEEWTNPYPCIEDPEYLINQFSMKNSFWFAIGSLMQQGTEIAPIGVSTRMVAGMWWFFVLIMVSSYTANLAAFLTTENPIWLFTDVHSLVENIEKHGLKMGAKAGGATASFFKEKDEATYKTIAAFMEENKEYMVNDNNVGVALAQNSTYAFFMESTSIEYVTQRKCDLQQYGQLLDNKGYGIALRKNSTYRKRLNTAILQLQASGAMDKLKRKWWEERRGGGQCSNEAEAQAATPLYLENVEGVFYVTIGGVVCSLFCVFLEMIINTSKFSVKTRTPFVGVLKEEMRAYLEFSSNVKPVPSPSEPEPEVKPAETNIS